MADGVEYPTDDHITETSEDETAEPIPGTEEEETTEEDGGGGVPG